KVVVTPDQAVSGRRRRRPPRRGGSRCVEGVALGLLEPFGRFEADGGQRVVGATVGVERFGRSSTAAQRADQDLPGGLVERKFGEQCLGLGDGGREVAGFHQCI